MSLTAGKQLLLSSPAAGGYQISRSLRFNSADSAYLSRTPASAGNRKTWTWAGWIKRSTIGTIQQFFTCSTSGYSSSWSILGFSGDKLQLWFQNGSYPGLQTTAVYRDTGAWMHVLMNCDTTQATSANRGAIYVNGVKVTAFDLETYPSQNFDTDFNSTSAHDLGRQSTGGYYCDFMLADVYWIDGQALTPSSFTETDASTGQLIPKAFAGSYGTNGFHLEFADNSNNTASTLGKDTSGNSNNWTPNNLSVTAGAGNDSLVDTPTSYGTDTGAGGEVRGNYCTLNPLAYGGDIQAPTNGNLDVTSGTSSDGSILGTFGMSSGKWYFEVTCNNTSTSGIGIAKSGVALADYPGQQAEAWVVQTQTPFYKVNNNTPTALTGTFNSGDIIGVAFDADNGNLSFYQNGSAIGSNAFTGLTNGPYLPIVGDSNSTPSISLSCNFGQRAFAYTAPSGFKALCDTNMTPPTIAKPNTVMDTVLWTGNNTGQTITLPGAFSPDLVWTKTRSTANNHWLFDVIRGTNQGLSSSSTTNELTRTNSVTAFESTGFTLGTSADVNSSAYTYVAWCWDAGSSNTTNNSGSITGVTNRVNATAGFSIVTYTGAGNTASTVGHGLGVAPQFIVIKNRTDADDWAVYHASITNDYYLNLNSTAAQSNSVNMWNDTSPTSTVFSLGAASGSDAVNRVNNSGKNYVAYCFAPVAGYSSFGSYTGNGSSQFVYLGFRPKFWMHKRTDSTGSWMMVDAVRSSYNVAQDQLYANLSNADSQYGGSGILDFVSNGVVLRSNGGDVNGSSIPYIYIAFAESPFAYSRAR